jgi:hypothetical protein
MMYYSPQVVRALTCERIREARGDCAEGRSFELPRRDPYFATAFRRLLGRRRSTTSCSC